MATQKQTAALIFSQLSAIIEKYGISQINDEYHDENPGVFSLSRNLADQRSRINFETNNDGDISSFKLRLSDNLTVPREFEGMVNYEMDFFERIGDPSDAFSYFSFDMENVNDEIQTLEEHLDYLKKRLRLRLYRHERKSAEEAKLKCEKRLVACHNVKVKKSVPVYCTANTPVSKKLSVRTSNALFKKLISLARSNMRDVKPLGTNATKRAISI